MIGGPERGETEPGIAGHYRALMDARPLQRLPGVRRFRGHKAFAATVCNESKPSYRGAGTYLRGPPVPVRLALAIVFCQRKNPVIAAVAPGGTSSRSVFKAWTVKL